MDELLQEFSRDEPMGNIKLTYDRQRHQWTHPSFIDVEYLKHAQEYKSEELCTIVDVFVAPSEVDTLLEMGGCNILYVPELNQDDPYYNPTAATINT